MQPLERPADPGSFHFNTFVRQLRSGFTHEIEKHLRRVCQILGVLKCPVYEPLFFDVGAALSFFVSAPQCTGQDLEGILLLGV